MTEFGWDTSHFDGIIPPATAKKAVAEGIVFATAKVSESNNYDDPADGTNLRNLRDAGVKILGGYHVVRSGGTTASQVEYHLSLLDRDEPWWRDFPGFFHQVDLELWGYDNVSAAKGMDFGKALEDASQKLVVMYASKGQYGDRLLPWKPRPLWNANYPSSRRAPFKDLYPGDDFSGWNEYSGQIPTFLQYASTATIGGMTTCDANAYRGTFDQLYQFITGGTEVTYPTAAEIENKVWHTAGSTGVPGESAGTTLFEASRDATAALGQSKANSSSLDEIKTKLDGMTSGAVDIDALVAALRPVIAEEIEKALAGAKVNFPTSSWTITY